MRHIPNILSVIRILLIPLFVRQMYLDHTMLAAVILAFSGLTDLLDGILARHFGWVSQVGKVLDPVADKLTQVTVCLVLMSVMHDYWFFFAVILLKEVGMLIMGGYLLRKKTRFTGARWFGKLVTTLFYCSIVAILFIPSLPRGIAMALLALTTLSAVFAAFLYWPEFKRYQAEAQKR
jgi:cardiolipin synthase